MLRTEGWRVNHKRVERIWRQEGLKVPQKQPKRGRLWLNEGSCIRLRAERKNHVWSYDLMAARTQDGRAFRILTIYYVQTESRGKIDSKSVYYPWLPFLVKPHAIYPRYSIGGWQSWIRCC